MGKNSKFERKPRDFYPTPYEAVLPVLNHLLAPYAARGHKASFIEPCAGDGRLIRHLKKHGHPCVYACDVEPMAEGIEKRDVLFFGGAPFPKADLIITNPPWGRALLHPMIELFRMQASTWLLFDADWMFTAQAKPYLKFCRKIVSVGRLSWEGNGVAGKDNCAWYNFRADPCETIFEN